MGRVTIFAIHGCPFCVKAKEALKSRSIPYVEINLTTHPDKRSDLLSLSDSLSVPQIFFNEKHIGGSVELIDLLETWDSEATSNGNGTASERYEKEVKNMPDPTDQRLQPSTKDAVKEAVAPPRDEQDKIKLPKSQSSVTVLEMTHRLLNKVPSTNLTYHGKSYKNSISGKDLSHCLMTEFDLSEKEALKFGLYLNERKLITHVTGDHEFIDTEDLFFRLQPYQSPKVLNSYRIWTDRVDPDSLAVLSRLSKLLQKVFDRATGTDGNVNLTSASEDPGYEKFEEEVCELQGIKMDEMDLNTKTAFVINLYNLMIKHAQVKVGVPSNNIQRATFFTGVKVNVGGEKFSFHELENGILRANAFPPYALKKVFSSDDKRLRLIVEKVDPRIHFGLNCGARSCPPVKKFTATDLNEELRIVALAFCEQDDNVMLKQSSNSLLCNTIFKWYMKDFAPSVDQLPHALLNFLKGSKKECLQSMIDKGPISVKFREYDWGSNVSHSKDFIKSDLKANEYSLKSIFCSAF